MTSEFIDIDVEISFRKILVASNEDIKMQQNFFILNQELKSFFFFITIKIFITLKYLFTTIKAFQSWNNNILIRNLEFCM